MKFQRITKGNRAGQYVPALTTWQQMDRNRVVREEICFRCGTVLTIMEYSPWNASEYIPVTVINGIVTNLNKPHCHKCFNTIGPEFDSRGWVYEVPSCGE